MRRPYSNRPPLYPYGYPQADPRGYEPQQWDAYPGDGGVYRPVDPGYHQPAYGPYGWDDGMAARDLRYAPAYPPHAYSEAPYSQPAPRAPERRSYRAQPQNPIQNPSDDLEQRLASLEAMLSERSPASHRQAHQQDDSIDTIMADLNARLADMESTSNPAPKKDGYVSLLDKIAQLEESLTNVNSNISSLAGRFEKNAADQEHQLQNVRFDMDGVADRFAQEVRNATPDSKWFDNLERTVEDIAKRQQQLNLGGLPDDYMDILDQQFSTLAHHTKHSTQQLELQIRALKQMISEMGKASPTMDLSPVLSELHKLSRHLEQKGGSMDAASLSKLEENVTSLANTMARMQDTVGKDLRTGFEGLGARLDAIASNQSSPDFAPLLDKLGAIDEVKHQIGRLVVALQKAHTNGADGNQIAAHAISEMHADLQKLQAKVDGLAPSELGRLEAGIKALSDRISGIESISVAAPDLSSLDNRLADLGAQIGQMGHSLHGAEGSSQLEEKLNQLIASVQQNAHKSAAPADLGKVEGQLASLMENYQETRSLISRFDRLEEGIGSLIEILADQQEQANTNRPPAPMQAAAPAFQPQQEPQAFVPQPQAPAAPSPKPAPQPKPQESYDLGSLSALEERSRAASADFAVEEDGEEIDNPYLPLKPGSKDLKPRIENAAEPAPAASTPLNKPQKPRKGAAFVDQASFINAARKTAQSANASSLRMEDEERAAKAVSPLTKLKASIAHNRKVLIYTFAGLSILISSIVIIGPVLSGGQSETTSEPVEAPVIENQINEPAPANEPLSIPAPAASEMVAPSEPTPEPVVEEPAPETETPQFTIQPRQSSSLDPAADQLSTRQVQTSALGPNESSSPFDAEEMVKRLSQQTDRVAESLDSPITTASIPTHEATSDVKLPETFGTRKLRQAAAIGQPDALIEVARRYAEGDGTAKSLEKAAYWYERAAGSGNPVAQYRIGSLYEKGHGVEKDVGIAKLWYQRAAEQGNTKAMHNLAVLSAQPAANGAPDFKTASQWFRRAAELGVTDSQYNLGVLYGRGMGVEKNLIESYKWFSIAAAKGDSFASEKRDEVFQMLSVEERKEAITLAENWTPQAMIETANLISLDKAYWGISQAEFDLLDDKEKIRRAQSFLGQVGYDAGPADGLMGPRTKQAIIDFKTDMNLGSEPEITLEMLELLRERASL